MTSIDEKITYRECPDLEENHRWAATLKTGNFEIHGYGEDRRTARRNAIDKATQGIIRPGGEVVPILSEEELRKSV